MTESNQGWTIVQRIRSRGLKATTEQHWVIGSLVREKYRQMYGRLPNKELRTKTNAGGTQCHAVYREPEFIAEIDAIIDKVSVADDNQLRLFE